MYSKVVCEVYRDSIQKDRGKWEVCGKERRDEPEGKDTAFIS
jgi:hypothetical protein